MTYTLAIETTSPNASVSLGVDARVLDSVLLPPLKRHTVDLMPTIDRLFRAHSLTPRDLKRILVSTGPGSFTGLRIGIATAKTLAAVLGCEVVAVPTIEAMAQNAPSAAGTLIVGLNLKAASVYAGVFAFDDAANRWMLTRPATLTTLDALLVELSGHVTLLGDPLPPIDVRHAGRYRILPAELATPRSERVYELGQLLAAAGRFTPSLELTPEYVREPEAKKLWDRKLGLA